MGAGEWRGNECQQGETQRATQKDRGCPPPMMADCHSLIPLPVPCISNRNENNLVENKSRNDDSGSPHDEAKPRRKIECHGNHGPDNGQ